MVDILQHIDRKILDIYPSNRNSFGNLFSCFSYLIRRQPKKNQVNDEYNAEIIKLKQDNLKLYNSINKIKSAFNNDLLVCVDNHICSKKECKKCFIGSNYITTTSPKNSIKVSPISNSIHILFIDKLDAVSIRSVQVLRDNCFEVDFSTDCFLASSILANNRYEFIIINSDNLSLYEINHLSSLVNNFVAQLIIISNKNKISRSVLVELGAKLIINNLDDGKTLVFSINKLIR